MEIVDPSNLTKHHHAWLEWLGLQAPPPGAEDWVPAVRGLEIDLPTTNSSSTGTRLVDELDTEGIPASQRLYQFYAVSGGSLALPRTGMLTYVAVVVHKRDLQRAVSIATKLKAELEREPQASQGTSGLSDDELTRLALESVHQPEE